MTIEPTTTGTWIAHGHANGIPFVAEAETRMEAFSAALDAVYQGAGRRKVSELSSPQRNPAADTGERGLA